MKYISAFRAAFAAFVKSTGEPLDEAVTSDTLLIIPDKMFTALHSEYGTSGRYPANEHMACELDGLVLYPVSSFHKKIDRMFALESALKELIEYEWGSVDKLGWVRDDGPWGKAAALIRK